MLNRLFIEAVNGSTFGSKMPRADWGFIGSTRVSVPPLVEQTAIAEFLDRETAKIDALVAEQERLIELLKEKRQAVISHAVTKGLNPDAPMQNSGVEWLGEIPAHWNTHKASRIGTLFGSEQIPEDAVVEEGGLPFIKVASLASASMEIECWTWFVDSKAEAKCVPRQNFIVFPKRGAAIYGNKVNVVLRPAVVDPNLMGWEIGPTASIRFMAYVLKARKLDELADVSTVPQINNKHIAPQQLPVPPLAEQEEIARHLDRETTRLDALAADASRAIDLLRERRSALISAAVTGQIDVRQASTRAA